VLVISAELFALLAASMATRWRSRSIGLLVAGAGAIELHGAVCSAAGDGARHELAPRSQPLPADRDPGLCAMRVTNLELRTIPNR
jgi:hypothetical protein